MDGEPFALVLLAAGPAPAVCDPLEDALQLREVQRQSPLQDPLQVAGGVGDALEEAGLPLEEPPVSVGAHRLHHAHEDVGPEVLEEALPVHLHLLREGIQVVVEEPLPHLLGKVRLGVVEEGRRVVVQGPAPPPLVVDEPGLAVAHHDVPRLEVPVEEVVPVRLQQIAGQGPEVPLEALLVERDMSQLQEVVLEVVEVPLDRAAVEGVARIGHVKVDDLRALHLEARQELEDPAVHLLDGLRERLAVTAPGVHQELEEGGVAQVLLEPDAGLFVGAVDLGHR